MGGGTNFGMEHINHITQAYCYNDLIMNSPIALHVQFRFQIVSGRCVSPTQRTHKKKYTPSYLFTRGNGEVTVFLTNSHLQQTASVLRYLQFTINVLFTYLRHIKKTPTQSPLPPQSSNQQTTTQFHERKTKKKRL